MPKFCGLKFDNFSKNYRQAWLQQFCCRIIAVILFHHLAIHLAIYELILHHYLGPNHYQRQLLCEEANSFRICLFEFYSFLDL
jgi:hypothetical protein